MASWFNSVVARGGMWREPSSDTLLKSRESSSEPGLITLASGFARLATMAPLMIPAFSSGVVKRASQ